MTDANVPLLESVIEIMSISSNLVKKLNAHPESKSDQQLATVEIVTIVLETQAEIIRRLVEHQLEISDELEKVLAKFESK